MEHSECCLGYNAKRIYAKINGVMVGIGYQCEGCEGLYFPQSEMAFLIQSLSDDEKRSIEYPIPTQ